MPTSARLVAGLMMAASGVIVILIAISIYPDLERSTTSLVATSGIVGLLVGWRELGRFVETDEGSGAVSGLRAGVSAIMWTLGVFALSVMIAGMLKHSYFQPMTAVLQIPLHMIIYGKMGLNLMISGPIVVFAMISGVMAKRAYVKWG